MESTSTSSTASNAAASGYLLFHRSRPASAAALSGEFATVINGILLRAGAFLAREGATRGQMRRGRRTRSPAGRAGGPGSRARRQWMRPRLSSSASAAARRPVRPNAQRSPAAARCRRRPARPRGPPPPWSSPCRSRRCCTPPACARRAAAPHEVGSSGWLCSRTPCHPCSPPGLGATLWQAHGCRRDAVGRAGGRGWIKSPDRFACWSPAGAQNLPEVPRRAVEGVEERTGRPGVWHLAAKPCRAGDAAPGQDSRHGGWLLTSLRRPMTAVG